MREDWRSMFTGIYMDTTYTAFHQDYVSKVQEEYFGRIESTRSLLKKEKEAVTSGKLQLTRVVAAVVESGANNEEQRAQMVTIMVKLGKIEVDVAIADDRLETLRTKKEANVARADAPENRDWLRNIESKTKNDATTAATFQTELLLKFDSIPEEA